MKYISRTLISAALYCVSLSYVSASDCSTSECYDSFVHCPGRTNCFQKAGLGNVAAPVGNSTWGYIITYNSTPNPVSNCIIYIGVTGCDITTGTKIGTANFDYNSFEFNLGSSAFASSSFTMYANTCLGKGGSVSGDGGNCYGGMSQSSIMGTTTSHVQQFTFNGDTQASLAHVQDFAMFPLGADGRQFLNGQAKVCKVCASKPTSVRRPTSKPTSKPVAQPTQPKPIPIPAPVPKPVTTPVAKSPVSSPNAQKPVPNPVAKPSRRKRPTRVTLAPVLIPPTNGNTVADIIDRDADLSIMANAIVVANLHYALSQSGLSLTTFSPVNGAFASLSQLYLATLLTPPWILHIQELILFHVTLARALFANDFSNNMIVTMINMENITISESENPFSVRITSAFTKGSDIIEYDLKASNGVVQKVDKVFLPKFYRTSLVQLLSQFSDYSIMSSLINSVPGLSDKLSNDGSYTLLAPTNKAWQALGSNKLKVLQDPANVNQLEDLLSYHILPIVLPTLQFKSLQYPTMLGPNVTLTIQNSNTFYFNDAKLVQSNGLARNGIANGLDKVLSIP